MQSSLAFCEMKANFFPNRKKKSNQTKQNKIKLDGTLHVSRIIALKTKNIIYLVGMLFGLA